MKTRFARLAVALFLSCGIAALAAAPADAQLGFGNPGFGPPWKAKGPRYPYARTTNRSCIDIPIDCIFITFDDPESPPIIGRPPKGLFQFSDDTIVQVAGF